MIHISEFQTKDVVNVGDGRRLGNITDFDINLMTGRIEAIVISGPGKVLGFFGRDEDVTIPWRNIVKVGADVILVRYQSNLD